MYNPKQKSRLFIIFLVFSVIFFLLFIRLAYLQVIRHNFLSKLAASQHELTVEIPAQRGDIYDRNKKELAISTRTDSLYAMPREIKDKEYTARILSDVLKIDQNLMAEKLNADKGFIWIARKLPPDLAVRIRSFKIKGLDFVKEYRRFYPNGQFCSHLLGYAGIDNVGLDGIELYYNKYLTGKPGSRCIERDAKGNVLPALESSYLPATDGLSLITTIDEVIQHIAERELDRAIKESNAATGTVIVMDPYSGGILALANRPSFDPNYFWNYDNYQRRNRAVADIFEPGSTFKIVTASAILNEKLLNPQAKFFCENGMYNFAGHTLHDHRPHGWLTFKEIIEVSSNIGTCKVAQILGKDRLYRYIKLFGFGEKTYVDTPGEAKGIVRPPRQWSGVSITNIPMGQEVGVTSIQLACAISAIANGGVLVKPRIVKEIIDSEEQVVYEREPTLVRRVITEEAAANTRIFLKGVVDSGTGQRAKVANYAVAGKTGTAQKLEQDGTYSHSKFIASFAGFAPFSKPIITIVVVLDEPHPYYFGGTVAAPVFSRIAGDTLRYLGLPPEKN
ncbi:MAG: penicillin-binding transpeptidase domain-containing protein [Candidatus Omnitrophota bacterium]